MEPFALIRDIDSFAMAFKHWRREVMASNIASQSFFGQETSENAAGLRWWYANRTRKSTSNKMSSTLFIHKQIMWTRSPIPIRLFNPIQVIKLSKAHVSKSLLCGRHVGPYVNVSENLANIHKIYFWIKVHSAFHYWVQPTITIFNPCYTLFQRLHQKICAAESWFVVQDKEDGNSSPLTLCFSLHLKLCTVASYSL